MITYPLHVEVSGVEITGSTYSARIRRGGSIQGPTITPEPGTLLLTIDGATLTPQHDPEVRPGRPVRITTADGPLMAATIDDTSLAFDGYSLDHRVVIEATDTLGLLAGVPPGPVKTGTLTQRLTAALTGTGVPATIIDTATPVSSALLAAEPSTALELVRLVKDTTYAQITADRVGGLTAVADRDRDLSPAMIFSDDPHDLQTAGVIHYTAIDVTYDTDAVVNVVEVDNVSDDTQSDRIFDGGSVVEWGPRPAKISVTDGAATTHAGRAMARRGLPSLAPSRIQYNATEHPERAHTPDPGMVVRVIRTGLLDVLAEIVAVEHQITGQLDRILWVTTLDLRPVETIPPRWLDMVPTMPWSDVPDTLTWLQAAAWDPFS